VGASTPVRVSGPCESPRAPRTGCRRLDDLAGGDGLGRCFAAPGPFLRAVFHEYSTRRGTRRLELHLMFSAYLATEGPILSRSREHSLVELLEMPATELGRVERASAAAFLRSIRIRVRDGTPAVAAHRRRSSLRRRPPVLASRRGVCLSLDWRGHAVEIAVGDLSADEPDRNQHHASRWAHVSFRVKWPSGVPLNGVPFRRWRPK
jgi:hypothetical protein